MEQNGQPTSTNAAPVTAEQIGKWISDASAPLGLFPSVIKSGENWSSHCEDVRRRARVAIEKLGDLALGSAPALACSREAVEERKALIAELLPLIEKALGLNGWDWMFPLRVNPVDGKPTIVSHKGGNLFRGYIGTWQEANLLVALANAVPRLILVLQDPPAKEG